MISSAVSTVVSSNIGAVLSSSTDSTPEIDTANFLYIDGGSVVNALYHDNDGIGQALFGEVR